MTLAELLDKVKIRVGEETVETRDGEVRFFVKVERGEVEFVKVQTDRVFKARSMR